MHYVTIDRDGGGEIYLAGQGYTTLTGTTRAAAREEAIGILTERAKGSRYPLEVTAQENDATFLLSVHNDGRIVVSLRTERSGSTSAHLPSEASTAWTPPPLTAPSAITADPGEVSPDETVDIRAVAASFVLELPDGQEVRLTHDVVVGRQPTPPAEYMHAQPIALGRAYSAVSKTHCLILVTEGRVNIVDLRSTNGTDLERGANVELLPPGVAIDLQDGDTVHLGDSATRIRITQRKVAAP